MSWVILHPSLAFGVDIHDNWLFCLANQIFVYN